jgi:hypothetical protein
MQQNLFWESNSRLAIQEFSDILWISKLHYRVNKSPPLVYIPSHMNPVYRTEAVSLRFTFIVWSNLLAGLLSGLFLLDFLTETQHV